MKIVQISPYAMDRPGGVQTHIRDLSHWLRTQGHEVRVVAPPGQENLEHVLTPGRCRNMSLHGTAFEISRANRRERAACLRALRDWGAEVVHLHTPWTPMLAWQIWRALKLPSVATFHATLPDGTGFDPFRWYIRHAARYFHKRLDAIVVPSEAPRAQWRALGVDPVPDILPPVIDLTRWRAARQQRPKGLHLVFMGRLEERKGVRVLLEAWPQVSAALPAARLTIAGAGELEASLKQMARDNALANVTFLPPPTHDEAPKLVSSADFFIAPATGGESYGLVLTEAMAAGALPIAAANPGYATVMTDAGKALLVPPADADALAQKILQLAGDPDTQANLRAWAAQRADSIDVAAMGPQFLAMYQAALDHA